MALRRAAPPSRQEPEPPTPPVTRVTFDVKYRIRGDDRLYTRLTEVEDEGRARSVANMLWDSPGVTEVQFLLNTQHMVGRKTRD